MNFWKLPYLGRLRDDSAFLETVQHLYDTVIRIFDGTCSEEYTCDDDGSEWASYPGGFVSKLQYEATAAETVVIMMDAYSSSTSTSSYVLNIVEGACD